jgi:GT2 family glycosyltransferase
MTVEMSVIAISLNSRQLLRECLASVRAAEWRGHSYEVIVVDNGSTDGTIEMLRAEFPDARVIANRTNQGLCRAANQGAAIANGRLLLFLNDDTLIRGDALALLIDWSRGRPSLGMIGSRLLNTDGTDQFSSGRRFCTPSAAIFGRKSVLTRWFPNARWARRYLMSDRVHDHEPYEVDWLSAAAMAVTREAFDAAGGLPEELYYFSEQVFCLRVKRAGFGICLHPRSLVVHHEGAGSGVRTLRVRRHHIIAFHRAAHQWYCLRAGIGPYHPLRLAAAITLALRAAALVAIDAAVGLGSPKVGGHQPEGGVTL